MNFFSEASPTFRNATQRRKKTNCAFLPHKKTTATLPPHFLLLTFYERRIRPHKLVV